MDDETIFDLMAKVREHPDYVFGTIFVRGDFPGEVVPDDFPVRQVEDRLAEHGNEMIDDLVANTECDECCAKIPDTAGLGESNEYHDESCSLYFDNLVTP
jgi:hypothetical protein